MNRAGTWRILGAAILVLALDLGAPRPAESSREITNLTEWLAFMPLQDFARGVSALLCGVVGIAMIRARES